MDWSHATGGGGSSGWDSSGAGSVGGKAVGSVTELNNVGGGQGETWPTAPRAPFEPAGSPNQSMQGPGIARKGPNARRAR
eukprot:11866176-Alexandrium_andersonii.AAC.1